MVCMSQCGLRFVILLLVTAVPFSIGSSVSAQGNFGQLPGPASSEELHQHLGRYLEFDISRAVDIGTLHEQYLADYKVLREGRIARWLMSAPGFESGMSVPDISKVRRYVTEQQSLLSAIRKLDDRLFNQLTELFGPDHFANLERARKSRIRSRARRGLSGAMGLLQVQDLWSIASEVPLNQEDYSALSAALASWEDRFTPLLAKAARSSTSLLVKMVEKLDEAGITGDEFNDFDQTDPEQIRKIQEVMLLVQQIFLDVRMESEALNADLRQLNSRTVRDLEDLIDPWAARLLKKQFLRKSRVDALRMHDNDIATPSFQSQENLYFSSFKLKSARFLDRDPRPLIEAIHASTLFSEEVGSDFSERIQIYVSEDNDRLDSMIKIQATMDPMLAAMERSAEAAAFAEGELENGGASSVATPRQLIDEAREDRNQSKVELLADLARVLELDSLSQSENRTFLRTLMKLKLPPVPERQSDFASFSLGVLPFSMGDPTKRPWMSAPIGGEVLDRLGGESEQHALFLPVLTMIHSDYLDSWYQDIQPLISAYHATDPEDTLPADFSSDWEASGTEVDARRRTALDSMRSIDSAFFEDLLAVAPPDMAPSIHLLQRARFVDLALAGSGYEPQKFDAAPQKQCSNVVRVLCDIELPPGVQSQIVAELSSELDELILAQRALQEERIDLSMKARTASQAQFEMMENDESGLVTREMLKAASGDADPHGSLPTLRIQVAQSEKALTGEVTKLLPEEIHPMWHQEIRKHAYPQVYRSDDRITSAFSMVQRLEAVTSEQTEALDALADKFALDWMNTGDQIIECKEALPDLGEMPAGEQMSSLMKFSTRSEQLAFDRGELVMVTLRRIASVLDSAQHNQIPVLHELGSAGHPISVQFQVEATLDASDGP